MTDTPSIVAVPVVGSAEALEPRSQMALEMLCAWNNIPPGAAPPEWFFHLGHGSRLAWERVADAARTFMAREGGEADCPAAQPRKDFAATQANMQPLPEPPK